MKKKVKEDPEEWGMVPNRHDSSPSVAKDLPRMEEDGQADKLAFMSRLHT